MGIFDKQAKDTEPQDADFIPDASYAPAAKAVESWADEKKTPAWLFGAAKAVEGWGEGRELTEAQYDAAVAKAGGAKMLSGDLIEKR